MQKKLEGRVAIVTGAGSSGPGWGNGKATAVQFAREGATVYALDVNQQAVDETKSIIESEGGICHAQICDVTNELAVQSMVDDCVSKYGRIDILHNNVGTNRAKPTAEMPLGDWEHVMNVNLTSIFLTCRAVLPVMEKQGKGVILNVSSVAALRFARVPYAAYSSSKAAILSFTRTIALEYAKRGVRANSIVPGLLNTPMVRTALSNAYPGGEEKLVEERNLQCPMGFMGDAWDIAKAAAFLASDDARYITGADLVIDGGLSCSTG